MRAGRERGSDERARWQAVRAGPCGTSRAGWAAREGERWAAGEVVRSRLKGGVRAGPKWAGRGRDWVGPDWGERWAAGWVLFWGFLFSPSLFYF